MEDPQSKPTVWQKIKAVLSYIFIDGLGGMAIGLFCTLIIGTIIGQVGTLIGSANIIGYSLILIGNFAKILMGAGIGIGMAYKLKKDPLVSVSAGVSGMVGAYASQILAAFFKGLSVNPVLVSKIFITFQTTGEMTELLPSTYTVLASVGEPLGAFIAAFVALEIGSLVSKKTPVDIIVTPIVAILSGSTIGLLVGPPISAFMTFIGSVINAAAEQQPILMGILVAVLMGIALTLPISSAAIGVMLKLSGVAAGAAVVGCCCQMVGFAVMSFKENKWGGLAAQGLGTSMLQMPNLVKHPVCWLPPVIASAVIGPFAATLGGIVSTPVGSGMGTAGLVGPIETFSAMLEAGHEWWSALLLILLFCMVLPAAVTLGISLIFRKTNLIKDGDLKLEL